MTDEELISEFVNKCKNLYESLGKGIKLGIYDDVKLYSHAKNLHMSLERILTNNGEFYATQEREVKESNI